MLHNASDPVIPSQKPGSRLRMSVSQKLPDPPGGDPFPLQLHRRDALHPVAVGLSQADQLPGAPGGIFFPKRKSSPQTTTCARSRSRRIRAEKSSPVRGAISGNRGL